MKRLFLAIMFLSSGLYAISLDELIMKALQNNPSLVSLNHRIIASHQDTYISNNFANPTLTYTQNNIDTDQAMSRKSVTLTQKLPYFGKRDSLKNIALASEEVLAENLEQAKVNILKEIRTQAYTAWEFQKLYKIILEYEDLTKQNIELFESYTSTSSSSSNQHMGIMSAELILNDLKIQKSVLNSKIKIAYARLSYLCAYNVTDLNVDIMMGDIQKEDALILELKNNHYVAIKDKEIKKSEAILKSTNLNNYPDINLIAGYSARENFDDYVTLGVGLTLPIYGTEDSKEQGQRALVLAQKSLKEDTKKAIDADFKTAYLQMKSANEIYHIINDEALPQLEHMFELMSSSIATGTDLFKYIDILTQKLKLEKKSIGAIADYNRAEAKITALSGEIQ